MIPSVTIRFEVLAVLALVAPACSEGECPDGTRRVEGGCVPLEQDAGAEGEGEGVYRPG